MRAYEFSNYLTKLAKLLKEGPDFDLDELQFQSAFRRNVQRHLLPNEGHPNRDDLPVALSALLSLSSIDKREWAMLIGDLGLPIEIRARDASRDLLGKVLNLLEKDPHSRNALMKRVKSRQSRASPELVRALSSLLGD
jgi:hypothetical protein